MTTKEKKELEVAEKKVIAPTAGEPTRAGVMYTPQVDIIEDPEAIVLFADLPGVKRDAVGIDVRDGVLTLSATVEPLPSTWQPMYSEYQVGGYERRFSVSDRIDAEKINAKLENGVLRLVLPKAEAQKPRKVKVG
ncbi:MAG: Hsp20/alpha crystallin family protein [Deltaproteobacteria bacterium]|nr:Hsp20/alpha crystallin family protein [Deltaproteobacteria bacterium]